MRILGEFTGPPTIGAKKNGYHSPTFPSKWGKIQGGLVSLTLLNVVADNVIQTWLAMAVEYQRVAHNGLGEAVRR